MKKFPIGLQTFSELVTENYYYIDKTFFISELFKGKYYFLSRPRRFGKSLLLSTLASAFRAEKELFKGLYLEKNWDWSTRYPVVDISFGVGVSGNLEELQLLFDLSLKRIAKSYKVEIDFTKSASTNFANLIQSLCQTTGQKVVVLVDEYDKPILDVIEKEETAIIMREALKNIYTVLKDNDQYIQFVLLTGVSKFSKVALFSGLNNLRDISLAPEFGSLCGYTEDEIKDTFAEHLHDVDIEKLRRWYNGYNFLGEKVYNPFDVLLYLQSKRFENYWFETGSPSFLLKLVRDRQYAAPDMENIILNKAELGTFDIDAITLETLLFQTGYLTIESIEEFEGDELFHLCYPNYEVKASLNQYLLKDLTQMMPSKLVNNRIQIYRALEKTNFEALKQAFQSLFAGIPNDWYRKNQLANYEGYYASVIYSCFCALGGQTIAEDCTNHGRIDLTLIYANKVFIFEFKVLESEDKQGKALKQVKLKNYQQKYQDSNNEVFLIGMEFEKQQRNLSFFEWEKV